MADDRLTRLLHPRSIAFVGGARAQLAAEQTRKFGYEGDIWWVHPNADFPTLADLPGVPEAVFVGVAAQRAIDIVAEANRLGVAGAVVYAAEFAEAGDAGADRQARLLAAAGDMPIIGPNCHGFVDARSGAVLWPDIHGCQRINRGVGIVTQSGNVAIDLTMQQRGLPIATMITTGNQANVTITDCLEALIDDPTITAIGLHMEGLRDSVRFGNAAIRAHAAGKPIAVLKTGSSVQGSIIANTHTASLSGPADAHRALFKRYGITQVTTPEELIGALSFFHTNGRLTDKQTVSFSCSGGEAQLMADLSEGLDVQFPAFGTQSRAELDRILEGRVAIENPLDYHTFIWGDGPRLETCFRAGSQGFDIAVLVIDFPAPGSDTDWWPTLDAFVSAVRSTPCAGVVTSTMSESLPKAVCEYLVERGVTPLPGMSTCLQILSRLQRVAPVVGPIHAGPPEVTTSSQLTEADAKSRLSAIGLPTPNGRVATGSGVVRLANEIGYPVALKTQSVKHRTEVGGVAIGLVDEPAVQLALDSMANIGDEFLVEQMIEGTIAELLIGIQIDRPVGWTLTIGAGGVLTEIIADTVTILLPTSGDEIRSAISSLAIDVILSGYRSQPPGDIQATVDTVMRLADFALTNQAEIEINPLLVCQDGVWIADALMEVWI